MKENVLKKITVVLLILILAASSFTAGFFVRKLTQGAGLSSYEWFTKTIDKYYYFGDTSGDFTSGSLKEIADKYLDRYSEYYTAAEYESILKSNSGAKSGLGVSYAFVEGKGVYVSSVVGNSPAYISGLRAGDWLESGRAEGGEQVDFTSAKNFSDLINSVSDGRELTFTSTEGTEYSMSKSEYTASYVTMSTAHTSWRFGDAETGGLALYEDAQGKMSFLPEGAAYMKLSQFYGTAPREFYVLAEKFNAMQCKSLILDLRSNGGGYVSVMQDIAGAFSGGGKKLAMLARDKRGGQEKYYCAEVEREYRIPADTEIYVLANSGTASASEALIGALVCYGVLDYENIFLSDYSDEYTDWLESTGQEVKTRQTFGKGIMQSTFINNSTKEALKLTTAQIYWPDGKTCIHDRGVTEEDGCTTVKAQWQHTRDDGELKVVAEIIKSR